MQFNKAQKTNYITLFLTRKINNSHFVEQKGVEREQVISLLKHSDIIVNVDLQ